MITSFSFAKEKPPRATKIFDVRDLPYGASDALRDRVRAINEYLRDHPGESIAIGCEDGQHKSPRVAQHVATYMRQSLRHRDLRPDSRIPKHSSNSVRVKKQTTALYTKRSTQAR